ncbi:MAG TPA: GtrA family protein [Mycobacteriales bacterium]|jgi:putative flippase GtrA|nr:GtrA family protein [Mycobacteriales bacterium]
MTTALDVIPRPRLAPEPAAPAPAPAPAQHVHRTSGQVLRFAAVGLVSTLAYVGLYAGLRTAMPALVANAVALLVTAVANTAANRRMTFAVRGRVDVLRHQMQGLGVFAVALAITSGSLGVLHLASAKPPRIAEIAVLVLANLFATALRFMLLRRVFRRLP